MQYNLGTHLGKSGCVLYLPYAHAHYCSTALTEYRTGTKITDQRGRTLHLLLGYFYLPYAHAHYCSNALTEHGLTKNGNKMLVQPPKKKWVLPGLQAYLNSLLGHIFK